MNITPEGIAILDKNGELIFTNKSIFEILGVTSNNVLDVMMNLKNSDYRT